MGRSRAGFAQKGLERPLRLLAWSARVGKRFVADVLANRLAMSETRGEPKPMEDSVAETSKPDLNALLKKQRDAFTAARPEPLEVRRDRVERAMALLRENGDALCKAMSADFGSRSVQQSMITDIAGTIGFGKYCLKHLSGWAKPERRKVQFPLGLLGAKAELRFEPKGVIGILAPWNFPVNLSFGPLMQVFAAGNRAMIKPSEFTERTSDLMAELVAKRFDAERMHRGGRRRRPRWRTRSASCRSTTWCSPAPPRPGAR